MSMSQESYVRQQGLRKTYDIEYSSLRYKISLSGKLLKEIALPLDTLAAIGDEATWKSAVADIEHLRGMPEE
jgi:tRNA A37 threonylcarbamoyladenosine synthetase subunit TsaC/SUA5/YrdC